MTRSARRRQRLIWAGALFGVAGFAGWWSLQRWWGVAVGSWLAFAVAFVLLNRESAGLVVERGTQRWRPLLLSAVLVAGLWVALPVVFSMADIGSGSSAALVLALAPDEAAVSVTQLAVRGVLATGGAAALLMAVMLGAQGASRRGSGRTSGGTSGGASSESATPPSPPDAPPTVRRLTPR